jgi:hypothetical protein
MTRTLVFLLMAVASIQATAKDQHYDGSDPLLCTLMTAQSCGITACEPASEDDLGGVKHLVVDFKRKRVASPGTGVDAPITTVKRVDNRLFLQGINEQSGEDQDDARSWTMAIADPTGMMTLSVVGEEVAFVIFGACTPVE